MRGRAGRPGPRAIASSRPSEDLGRVAERRERPDPGQRLEDLAVGQPEVDPGAEVGERAERAALGPRGDDRFDRALADVLHGQQPEPDRRRPGR